MIINKDAPKEFSLKGPSKKLFQNLTNFRVTFWINLSFIGSFFGSYFGVSFGGNFWGNFRGLGVVLPRSCLEI